MQAKANLNLNNTDNLKIQEVEFLSLQKEFEDIDLSQIVRNLNINPDLRLKEHQVALNLVLELEKAGNIFREQSQ